MNNLSQKQLVDTLIDAYVSWREACLRVSDAYRSWASETGPSAASPFECCMAALEQEERAAEVYAALVRRADQLVREVPRSVIVFEGEVGTANGSGQL